MSYYQPESRPRYYFETIIDLYEQDFRRYWGLDERDSGKPDVIIILDRVAEKVIHAVRTMGEWDLKVPIAEVWKVTREVDEAVATFLSHRFELAFASEMMWDISGVADRAEALIGYLVRARSDRTRAYLHRVANCFLRGMETETLIMVGAVLETALEEACPPEAVKEKVPAARGKKNEYVTVRDRLNYLTTVPEIDYEVVERADWLWQNRGKAVHAVPGIEPTMDEVMEAIVLVLNGLERLGNRERRNGD